MNQLTIHDFSQWLQGIADIFGSSSYTAEQVAVLYDEMKDLTMSDLQHIRNGIVLECAHKPSPGKIKALALPAIQRAGDRTRDAKLNALRKDGRVCVYCDNSGRFEAYERGTNGRTVLFACRYCQTRHLWGLKTYPLWSEDGYKGRYVRVSLYDINLHLAKSYTEQKPVEQILDDLAVKTRPHDGTI